MGNKTLNKISDHKALNVAYPLSLLWNDDRLFDPENTETVYQYYLLENLAVGLVRDDPADPRSYTPVLAKDWKKMNPSEWIFQLKPDLKWSDDSPIAGKQILNHFLRLKESSSRHIVYLKHLESLQYNEAKRELKFVFSRKTNKGLLHELSLADAALVHPDNLTKNWEKTSGPYYVEKYDPKEKRLILRSNKNCMLISEDSPDRVVLFSVKNEKERKQFFKALETDIIKTPIFSFRPLFKEIEKNAVKVLWGYPTSIHYFAFNDKHPLSKDKRSRQEFSYLVQESFKESTINEQIRYENQFVPLGFSGRLESYKRSPIPINILKNRSLVVNFHEAFKELPNLLEKFKNIFAQHNIDIQFDFTAYAKEEQNGDSTFAVFRNFVGNQRDSLGSWSFLFSGTLAPFKSEVSKYFERAATDRTEAQRNFTLKELHKKVLDEAYTVPFMIEATGYLMSDRIDISRWNLFDMRMRFYDVRWQ